MIKQYLRWNEENREKLEAMGITGLELYIKLIISSEKWVRRAIQNNE